MVTCGLNPSTRPFPSLLLGAACCLAAFAPGALAQEDEVLETDAIRVEAQSEASPRMYEETAIETQVIERKQIQALPASDVAEAIKAQPGLRVQQRIQGERAVVSIEGLPPEYTRVLVNGQRYTGQIGEAADLSDLPTICVDRIEIQRGSQTLNYGVDAGGGVINAITRKPPEEGGFAVGDGGAGQDERWIGSAAIGQSFGPVGGVICVEAEDEVGYDPRVDPDTGVFVGIGGEDTEYETRDFYTSWEAEPLDGLKLLAQGGYREELDDFVTPDGDNIGSIDFDRTLASGGFEWQVGSYVDLRGSLVYFRGTTNNTINRDFELDEDQYEIDAAGTVYFDTGPVAHSLMLGVDVRRPTLDLQEDELGFDLPDDFEDFDTLTADRSIDKERTDTGYVVRLDTEIFERLHLVSGLRYQDSTDFGDEWLPQVALLYSPTDWLSLRASYARNVRYPSLRDLFQPDTPQLGGLYFLGGNPSLQPEQSDSYRFGFELTPRPWFALSAVGYWNEIDDFIRSRPFRNVLLGFEDIPGGGNPELCDLFPDDPSCEDRISPIFGEVFRPFNLDEVRTAGVESSVRLRWKEFVDLNVAYTYQDTDVDSRIFPDLDELPNEPEHTVDIQLVLTSKPWGRILGRTQIGASARWRDEALVEVSGTGLSTFTSTGTSDESWEVDTRLTQSLGEHVKVYFDVRNVTDEKTVDSYQIRGRTFFGGAKVELDWHFDPVTAWF